ncbi:hypothetical protein P153DRAFT_353506 [Dothidotthia symphoricarpi CBS 119687]|uniref:Uncharacterized protein n=1 Tax=Dothidotthia symphoricarpi CBS 119687 TaxID=1392245 RepID=A0A6A6AQY5_9PLEO|nr:uncharacterized protein P153DRAFT_353506 [Dothidotthia symphoricarpi CBS 119687]KAF2134349.1 hypothetical protein P153DRAFT_353506 [Dothidotthia symphoricarpi CBS 119687]
MPQGPFNDLKTLRSLHHHPDPPTLQSRPTPRSRKPTPPTTSPLASFHNTTRMDYFGLAPFPKPRDVDVCNPGIHHLGRGKRDKKSPLEGERESRGERERVDNQVRTRDMGGNLSTKEFTRAVLGQIEKA